MLNEMAWLAISLPVQPKDVRWGLGEGFVRANHDPSNLVFMDPALCTGHACKIAFPKLCPQSWKYSIVQNILVCLDCLHWR